MCGRGIGSLLDGSLFFCFFYHNPAIYYKNDERDYVTYLWSDSL